MIRNSSIVGAWSLTIRNPEEAPKKCHHTLIESFATAQGMVFQLQKSRRTYAPFLLHPHRTPLPPIFTVLLVCPHQASPLHRPKHTHLCCAGIAPLLSRQFSSFFFCFSSSFLLPPSSPLFLSSLLPSLPPCWMRACTCTFLGVGSPLLHCALFARVQCNSTQYPYSTSNGSRVHK